MSNQLNLGGGFEAEGPGAGVRRFVPRQESIGSGSLGEPPPAARGGVADDLTLRALFDLLLRRKWIIVAFTLASLGATIFLVQRQPARYTATAVIRLEDTQRELTGTLDRALSIQSSSNLSQLQTLRSNEVLGAAVDRGGLRLIPAIEGSRVSWLDELWMDPGAEGDTLTLHFSVEEYRAHYRGTDLGARYGEEVDFGVIRFQVRRHPGIDVAQFRMRSRPRAIQALASSLRATTRSGTDVVDIQYTSTDPVVAQRVVNAAVEAFRDRNISTARQSSERRRIFLEEQMLQAEIELRATQAALSEFRSREAVFSLQSQFVAQQSGLQQLETRRAELAADRGMFRNMVASLRSAPPGEAARRVETLVASPQIAGNPVVGALFNQLLNLETNRNSLVSGPGGLSLTNPDVIRLDEQIVTTLERLQNAVESHLESLDARMAALDQQIAQAEAQIIELPNIEAEEARLVQELRSIERTFDQLREEYQRARLTEAVEAGRVEVIDFAGVPLDPLNSGAPLRLAMGLFLGLILGSGSAFLLESLNTKIRRREEMESILHVPSVGVVPRLPGASGVLLGSIGLGKVRRMIGGGGGRNGKRAEELVTVTAAQSPHAEAYRSIRTNLLYSDAVTALKTVVITSPTPGEGKSTTASNLAVAYAQQGMKVLLIDCDLRKARLHYLFALPREPGLTELVLGKATWEEVVHDGPVEDLQILTSGIHPPNPSELIGGARMRRALDLFKEHYDVVILDTPPLIAGPDAAILGSYCDGVVLVVRAGQTEREAGQQAVRQLHTVGARILGAVLNDPDGELPKYSSYYAYQYKYYGGEV